MKLKCSSLLFFIIILSCFELLLAANIKGLSKCNFYLMVRVLM